MHLAHFTYQEHISLFHRYVLIADFKLDNDSHVPQKKLTRLFSSVYFESIDVEFESREGEREKEGDAVLGSCIVSANEGRSTAQRHK